MYSCIYRLIHGYFQFDLVIIPRPPYWPETGCENMDSLLPVILVIQKCLSPLMVPRRQNDLFLFDIQGNVAINYSR
jgi:hypothetical protein